MTLVLSVALVTFAFLLVGCTQQVVPLPTATATPSSTPQSTPTATASPRPTPAQEVVTGEIDDSEIRIAASSVPTDGWLELRHVGTEDCSFVGMLSPIPAGDIATFGGMVTITEGDPALPGPVRYYAELNGYEATREDAMGTNTTIGVAPGDTVRMQLMVEGRPEGNLLLVCNEPGGFAAGRYAEIPFAP